MHIIQLNVRRINIRDINTEHNMRFVRACTYLLAVLVRNKIPKLASWPEIPMHSWKPVVVDVDAASSALTTNVSPWHRYSTDWFVRKLQHIKLILRLQPQWRHKTDLCDGISV